MHHNQYNNETNQCIITDHRCWKLGTKLIALPNVSGDGCIIGFSVLFSNVSVIGTRVVYQSVCAVL